MTFFVGLDAKKDKVVLWIPTFAGMTLLGIFAKKKNTYKA